MCIVLEKLGDFPSQQDLLNEIQKLVELFRRFSRPPIKTIQGLWAELFVIEHSSNPSYLVKSWHTTTSDIFDFNDGTDKLEVKSTSRINRVHRFSHNQLTPNESSIVVIASLCVQQSGVGKTVLDLMDAIEPNLENAELRFQLADMISKTLGSDFEKACEYYFDYALGQFTRNYTQTVKRAADNKRRYAPGEGSIPPVLLSGVSKGACPLAHDFACKV